MKQYGREIDRIFKEDSKKDRVSDYPMVLLMRKLMDDPKLEVEPIMSSDTFIKYWKKHIDDIALFKTTKKGKKRLRGTSHSEIGILNRHDVFQEAYYCFLRAYNRVDWGKIKDSGNPEAQLWAYLKKSTILDLAKTLRGDKDGQNFGTHYERGSVTDKYHLTKITGMFSQLDKVLIRQDDESMPKYEAEVLGFFIDDLLEDYLDVKSNGDRNKKGIERRVIKSLFGLDEEVMSYKEISDYYNVSESTLRKVKQRALDKLKSPEVRMKLAEFLSEYRISTKANV